jgi:hypothetical protein
MYPGKFDLVWATEKELNLTKRMFAKDIGKYSREQIDEALAYLKKLAAEGDKKYLEPNVLVFLQVIGQLNVNKAMYQRSLPPPPMSAEERAERNRKGIEHCQRLKGLFND